MPTKSIQLNATLLRLIIIVAIVFVFFLTYLALRWVLGSTLARQSDNKQIAELAIELAPNDPEGYYSLATISEKSFLPEDFAKALENYEKAVSVSPSDFRLWLALGKARERAGDDAGAEKALRKALELAPNYSEIHWVFGNFLLRQGNEEEAFLEIRKAVQQDEKYSNPAVVTLWQIFNGDVAQISQKIGDSIPIKAALAPFLVKQKRFDEALSFWNSISNEEKTTTYKKVSEDLLTQFVEAKSFRNALNVQNQISKPEDEKFTVGNIFNSDFEKDIKAAKANLFDWGVIEGAQPQISLDGSQKHGGNRSLILLYNSDTGKDLRGMQQTIVVDGGKTYKFEGFYRAELKTLATLKWEIVDAGDGKVLASTNEIAASANWSPLSADIIIPATTEALILRLGNVTCKQAICPISGKIWFDDFSLR